MPSPANYHLRIPKEWTKNLLWRKWAIQEAHNNPLTQQLFREICRRDILFYINGFVWQYNPRKKGNEVGPFITWDYEEEAIFDILGHMERDRDLLIEKSREVGVSWICLIIDDWLARFRPRQKFLSISHTEGAVDRPDDPDSLFWKLEFINEHMPDWMSQGVRHRKMSVIYPATKSCNFGVATTVRAGVSGRATGILLDEFGKQTNASEIWGQTADTGCRIIVSTHYGPGTMFFHLSQLPFLDKRIIHWSQHPDKKRGLYRYHPDNHSIEVLDKQFNFDALCIHCVLKDKCDECRKRGTADFKFVMDGSPTGGPFPRLRSPWYDAECLRRANARDVAMHLDIDPKGSVTQFFDAITIAMLKAKFCTPPLWEGDLHYDKDTAQPLKLIPVKGGPLKLWIKLPNDGKPQLAMYGAGGDIAAGTGATPSCLSFGNAETGEKVAEYRNAHIEPSDLAPLAVALCRLFRSKDNDGALFAWEMPGPGLIFAKRVIECGYRNIYYRTNELKAFSRDPNDVPGWFCNATTKRLALEEYRAALHSREFLNFSEDALTECLDFKYAPNGTVEHGGVAGEDPSAARDNHGDMVIADALDWKMQKQLNVARPRKAIETIPILSLDWRRKWHEDRKRQQEVWA